MLVVRFNDLQVENIKSELLNNVQSTCSSKRITHEPYYLIENSNITVTVNDSLEKVNLLYIVMFIKMIINLSFLSSLVLE